MAKLDFSGPNPVNRWHTFKSEPQPIPEAPCCPRGAAFQKATGKPSWDHKGDCVDGDDDDD